jgi:murein DD-endopeptidase MepM/ murein hydrolase activator NlpD
MQPMMPTKRRPGCYPPAYLYPAQPALHRGRRAFLAASPCPRGGVVWTDKVYPYGGTRGGTLRPHHGVEFMVPNGTPMLAAASGTVVVAGNDSVEVYGPQTGFYGNLVVIELDSRYQGQPSIFCTAICLSCWSMWGSRYRLGR